MKRKIFLTKMLVRANQMSNSSRAIAGIQAGSIKQECAKAVIEGIISPNDYETICKAITETLANI